MSRLWRVLGRAVRLRCPRCGRSALFAGWFTMLERCAVCGLVYEREPGYFVGAIYLNYAATVTVAFGTVLLLDWTVGLTLREQLALGITLVTLVPLLFFRYSRSLWLALDHLVTRLERRPAPPR
ncbi:MAG: DUF983 domain-containing protein [Deltaproteobacteria bacterium]|nr:MAG: DUF983 domain-containing protein [Deltaproteobacteria bacterium]